jgi:pyrroline-5-carboxylate reductase
VNSVGFVGVGDLALYTIRGWRRGGYRGRILLSPRNRETAGLLASECACEVAADNQAVVDGADLVVIATRPADCLAALEALEFGAGQVLVSVVAGIDSAELRRVLPADLEIVRAMPVSSAAAGASPTLIYPQHGLVRELFDRCGNTIAVDSEDYFNHGSILACVYSWFFALYGELIEATQGPGLPAELSAELVLGMAQGAARLALTESGSSPRQIAAAIATDGTYSKLGLDLLEDREAFAPWHEACELLAQKLAANR